MIRRCERLGVGLKGKYSKFRHLTRTGSLRNREFESAVNLIEELRGHPLPSGAVTGAKIDELEGKDILEKLVGFAEAAKKGTPAKGIFKVDQTTTKEAGIFGCLLDALTKGLLTEGWRKWLMNHLPFWIAFLIL